MGLRVFVDFDGTIAPSDPTDSLFAAFADPSWRDIEQEWQQGRSTARDCMRRQTSLIDASPDEVDSFLETIVIDPGFQNFVKVCRRAAAEVVVVSDGFDRVVGTVLSHAGLDLPFTANRLISTGPRSWAFEPRAPRTTCDLALGNCKCSYRSLKPGMAHVMVGDGRSDFCVASEADFVLAKGTLADHCEREQIAHVRIRNFKDASKAMELWLRDRDAAEPARVANWGRGALSTSA